ncbi:MAG: chain length-determining protein [Burkholderiales bacterium]|nr:chain length-determining protein [Burkholderiales bacterium]
MHELAAQLFAYSLAVWRHRWYILVTAWVVSIGGWIAIHYLPNRFEASARVYVDTQSLLRPLMAGIAVQPNTNQQVAIMANPLINRPNLEKVARMTDLELKAKTPAEFENIINDLSRNIKLKGTGYEDNLYTISYENRDPTLAKKVVQTLLNIFVENGLGSNRKNIASSTKFIEEQLQSYEEKLINAENALKDFKRRNIGVMPGETGQDYYSELAAVEENINQAQMSLNEATNRRDALKRQLSGDDPTLLSDTTSSDSATPEIDERIRTLKTSLDNLRLKYTDQYPDIVATKQLIAELEATRKKELSSLKPSAGLSQNSYYQQLNLSLADAEADVAAMQARLDGYQKRYNGLKAQADKIPEVEAEYTQLTRNYDIYKKNYDTLLSRRESAKLSGEMETKTDVVDFRVIDPPRVPLTPSPPNRPLLISMAFLGSIAAGIAVAFLRSQIRRTVDNRKDLYNLTDFPLLGTVAKIETRESKLQHRKELMIYGGLSLMLFLAYLGLVTIQLIRLKMA